MIENVGVGEESFGKIHFFVHFFSDVGQIIGLYIFNTVAHVGATG
jgi:hypothetical protein